jgi:organic radical activating enzyme
MIKRMILLTFDIYEIKTEQTEDCTESTDNIYFCGCTIHCEFCNNKKMWNFNNAKAYTIKDIIYEIQLSPSKWVAYMGGEPMEQPLDMLYDLTEAIHKLGKKVIMFTSYPPIKFRLPNVDAYHVDIKYFLDWDYTPLYRMNNVSFGIVSTGEDTYTLLRFEELKEYPIYVKINTITQNELSAKNCKNILLGMGCNKVFYDRKINIGVYNGK